MNKIKVSIDGGDLKQREHFRVLLKKLCDENNIVWQFQILDSELNFESKDNADYWVRIMGESY